MPKRFNTKEEPKRVNDETEADSNEVVELTDKIKQLESKISKRNIRGLIFVAISFLAIFAATYALYITKEHINVYIFFILFGLLCFILGLIQLSDFSLERNRTNLEIERKEKEREAEVKNIKAKGYILIRYKQALDDRDRLTIYRDSNIFQQKNLFALGMTAMIFGLFSIIMGVVLLFIPGIHQDISVIFFGLCGIISETIGVFVIKMYSENLKVSIKYSSDIVHNDDIIFAHALATGIKNKRKKTQTISEVAKLISAGGSGTKE